ncbi:hypothetical protein [Halorubrum trueperi]|uniref:Uncharacterized protein n=1 Tax=Halorubrum trueperi TaxID=2004704 RepID=A0ABD5UHF8_9EURY
MNDSHRSDEGSIPASDGDPERSPRYDQVVRWVEYIEANPPAVWGPQQNAVVDGQIESARAADVSADDRDRIRRFAERELRSDEIKHEDETAE